MAFSFSAMQYERGFRGKSLSNWEYPRFFPPRPRGLKKNSCAVCDKNGHLLPTAKRGDNFLGHYRGTYHLPLRITRSFATLYNTCLSGRYKYSTYPRDICCCQREQQQNQCDWRETLGTKDDPLWQKPKCQSKCEGFQQLLAINEQHIRCKRKRCQPKANEKLIPRVGDSSMRNRKRLRKRPVTAFEYNRRGTGSQLDPKIQVKDASKEPSKEASKDASKDPTKEISKEASKEASKEKSTAKSPTKAPSKMKAKHK